MDVTASSCGLQRAVPMLFVCSKPMLSSSFEGLGLTSVLEWKSEGLPGVGEGKKKREPTIKSHDSKTVLELINTLYKSEAKPRPTTSSAALTSLQDRTVTNLCSRGTAEEQQEENSST